MDKQQLKANKHMRKKQKGRNLAYWLDQTVLKITALCKLQDLILMLCWVDFQYLPPSQNFPVTPAGHLQNDLFSTLTHVPPFLHGRVLQFTANIYSNH